MKKPTFLSRLFIIALSFLLFCSCAEEQLSSTDSSDSSTIESNIPEETSSEASSDVDSQSESPVVLVESLIPSNSSGTYLLKLEMIEGKYYPLGNDTFASFDNNWIGSFQLCVYDTSTNQELDRIDVQFVSDSPLHFPKNFSTFCFSDYNCDGNPDFTLGQRDGYSSSCYRIYTVSPEGKLSELVEGKNFPSTASTPSVCFEMTDDRCMIIPTRHMDDGKIYDYYFYWDGNDFSLKQTVLSPAFSPWTEPTVQYLDPWSAISEKQLGAWYVEPTYDFDDMLLLDHSPSSLWIEKIQLNNTTEKDYYSLSFFRQNGQNGLIDQHGNIIFTSDFDVRYCSCGLISETYSIMLGPHGEKSNTSHGHGGDSIYCYDETNHIVFDYGWSIPLDQLSYPHILQTYQAFSEDSTQADYYTYQPYDPPQYLLIGTDFTPISQERFLQFRARPDFAQFSEYRPSHIRTSTQTESDKIAVQTIEGNWKFIDMNGNDLDIGIFEDALPFHEGVAAVKKDGKWGYINESGETILPFIYDDAASVYNSLAWVKQNGLWGVMIIFDE